MSKSAVRAAHQQRTRKSAIEARATTAILVATSCVAASALAGEGAATPALEEVVVTGSRVIQNGFDSPTPLTVMGEQDIQAAGIKDVSEFVQELPAIAGSWDMQSQTRQGSSGTAGLAAPALRALGTNRTLVLLDGQRSVPSTQTGQVDTTTFPQMLISRVEIVTGGASATYGSDAVSGVINYILDKRMTGFKAEVSGGLSTYGDDENGTLQLAGGFPFAAGRGHVLLSGELYRSEGIFGASDGTPPKRDWLYNPDVILENPAYTATNGQPFYIIRPNLGDARAIKGALIYQCTVGTTVQTANCPLRGTAFGDGGTTFQYNFGQVVGNRMSGGDWQLSEVSGNTSLDPIQSRQGAFARVSYDLTENFNVYAQLARNHSESESSFCCVVKYDIDIRTDNPYIPASVLARANALGVTTFRMGSFLDNNHLHALVFRDVDRYVVGAEGSFGLFGRTWKWDGYFQYGKARALENQVENVLGRAGPSPLNLALDAVLSPTSGAVVCRIKLTEPNNPCQPYNPFGWGVVSQAALDYIGYSTESGSQREEIFRQDVVGVSVTGEPFSLWAGPVSLAFGAEHRHESLAATVDPYSANLDWLFNNFSDTDGSYSVTEAFIETLIPLARDKGWAQSLDFNAAVRETRYSTSGYVTTWKAGMTWSPIDDIRFRATRSRDIRAPNISELFTTGLFTGSPLDDPFTGLIGVRGEIVTQGNPDLKPEEADTTGVGVVLQPRFLPRLSASVDYYDIVINGAIGTIGGAQDIINQCFAGRLVFCDSITRRPDGTIQYVYNQPVNFVKTVNRGVDFEVGYSLPLTAIDANLTFRYLATHYIEAFSDNGLTPPLNSVGQNTGNLPDWRHRFSVSYSNDPVMFTVAARAISAGTNNNTWIECDSGCPTSTVDNRTIQVGGNQIRGYLYFDTTLAYQREVRGARAELFFNVRNLFDKDPVRIPGLGTQGTRGNRGTADGVYDMIGRSYRAGVRIRM